MINTINTSNPNQSADMWQYPPGTDEVAGDIAEMQQHHYVNAIAASDTESQAVEGGKPLTPIREGGASASEIANSPENGAYNTSGEAVVPQAHEAVIATANQDVDAAFAAMPEAQAARLRQEHHNAANVQAGIYAPYVEQMRARVLNQNDYELAA